VKTLDTRLNAYRPDLADSRLKGQVEAGKFVDGEILTVVEPRIGLRSRPDIEAGFITEALLGSRVRVFERDGAGAGVGAGLGAKGWAWGQMEKDNYVGYMPAGALRPLKGDATHRVCVPATFIYPKADLKSQPAIRIFLNSLLIIDNISADWAALSGGGFVYHSHICLTDQFASDPVAIAEQFINVPYLWGGNTQDGLDCSALVQQAYHACGKDCPRDSDMIEEAIGEAGHNSLQRGDLVFWDGHIGMILDERRMIHANGHHMAVAIEDFAEVEARISQTFDSSARFKRVDP